MATSQTEAAEISSCPARPAARSFSIQAGESFPGIDSAIQIQTGVSSSRGSTFCIPDFAGRPHDVAKNGNGALHVAHNIALLILHRDKLCLRFTALGDHDLAAPVAHLVH